MAFWTLIVILIQSGRMPTHSGSRRPSSDTRSIIGLEPAKRAVEKHSSDLLAVSERNVDLKRFSPAEIAGVARRLLVMELKRSVFNVLHEDLEQSFCAEIAVVEKHLKTLKETKGNKSIVQTAERVERSEKEESQVGKVGKVGECEFNVLKFLRASDLMFECGLTFTDASRKAESACVNMTSILICWTCVSRS